MITTLRIMAEHHHRMMVDIHASAGGPEPPSVEYIESYLRHEWTCMIHALLRAAANYDPCRLSGERAVAHMLASLGTDDDARIDCDVLGDFAELERRGHRAPSWCYDPELVRQVLGRG